MRGIRKLNSIPGDCRVAIPAAPGSSRGGAGRVQLGANRPGARAFRSPPRPCSAAWAPKLQSTLCAGSSRLATPEPARAPSIAEPGPGVPGAAAKPGILPGGGGCTGARTENLALNPIGVTA
nr:translation initiation factor IF-2-like [Chlorocebus sabaeus]